MLQPTLNFLLLHPLEHVILNGPLNEICWALLPDANVGIVIGVLVCRFEFFSFGSFCNAIAIEMRPGV